MTKHPIRGGGFSVAACLAWGLAVALHGCSSDPDPAARTDDSNGTSDNGTSGSETMTNPAGAGGSVQNSGSAGSETVGTAGTSQSGGTGGARMDGGSPANDASVRTDSGSAGSKADSGGTGGSTQVSTDPPCLNGKKDGNETGIDCGGSCPACPNYKINPPNKTDSVGSACGGGPGYMCARSMVFSPEMKQAALDDWGMADPPFVYGTVGHDADNGGLDNGNTCCQCYQLVFDSPADMVSGMPPPKPMIVQTFNTAAGGGQAFDVYMAAGGFGANNGCTGGNPMYDKYPDLGGNYTGGVRATRYSQCASQNKYSLASISSMTCQSYVEAQCEMITSSASATNQSTSRASCEETNFPDSNYHMNWNVRAKRIECPENLTRVTGCKLNNQGLPKANPAVQTVAQADTSFRSGYHTTTMQDCCRPTCAYPGHVSNADGSYSVFYTCDKSGNAQ
jgi:hypothetical protein